MDNNERVARIEKMEKIFDILLAAAGEGSDALRDKKHLLSELMAYYEGGLWLSDYEADERGELPKDLKRGVLSEDGLYDLLTEIESKKRGTE